MLYPGLVSSSQPVLVTDRNKIRRQNLKVGNILKEKSQDNDPILGLYFDSRKDDTMTPNGIIKEEHISLVAEPCSRYIGHVTTLLGNATDECNVIYKFSLNELSGGLNELLVLGCNGTNVNTGWKGGVLRKLEEKLGRPMQGIVCLIHFNELPFRSIFEFINGPTSGPHTYTGPIGSKFPGCEKLSIVKYKTMDCDIPKLVSSDLSKDQRYLLEISKAIRSGTCPDELRLRNPGRIHKACWLTTANRILRLFISTKTPCAKMRELVRYLLSVYVPMWFSIRKNHSIADGTRHLFETIRRSRYLPVKYRTVVDNSIARNAYFAMPENILLSMMTDHRPAVRKEALNKILKAEEKAQNNEIPLLRYNVVPKINFKANDYTKIINWSSSEISVTVPPVLRNVTNEELVAKLSNTELVPEWNFSKFPCHTMAVERTFKLVTEASATLYVARTHEIAKFGQRYYPDKCCRNSIVNPSI